VFDQEKVLLLRIKSDMVLHGASFLQCEPRKFVDFGNQSGKRWRLLEKPIPQKATIVSESLIIPWGLGGASYGDFLIQVLPKLARILCSMPASERVHSSLSLSSFPQHPWARFYLGLLGFPADQILDGSSPILVPKGGRVFAGSGPRSRHCIAHPDDINMLLGLLEPHLPPFSSAPWRKLYISRRTGRAMANENDLVPGLHERGFEVIQLENHTVEEQILMFRQAAVVVGPHGAGHANIMWSAPGTSLLEVFDPTWMHPCYALLAEMRGIHYHCLAGFSGLERGSWSSRSRYGIFENPRIDPDVFFRNLDPLVRQ
jgi:capsular polysaccharide biosynthesis protein